MTASEAAGKKIGEFLGPPGPGLEERCARVERSPARRVDRRREHLAPLPVEPPGDHRTLRRKAGQPGRDHRVQGRHADDRAIPGERESLNRRDADAQSGKRSRSRYDGKQIHISDRVATERQPLENLSGKPLRMCTRAVTDTSLTTGGLHAVRA